MANRSCRNCNTDITHRHGAAVYCSQSCSNKWRKHRRRNPTTETKQCAGCELHWETQSSHVRYCSLACYHVDHLGRDRCPLNDCPQCGKLAGQANATGHPYCSTRCRKLHRHLQSIPDTPHCGLPRVMGWCPACGDPFVDGWQNATYCSPTCNSRAASRRSASRRRAQLRQATSAPINRRRIYERDGWVCQLCGTPVNPDATVPDPEAPVLDHIVALVVGGPHTPANVQLAHFLCNSQKGDGTPRFEIVGLQ